MWIPALIALTRRDRREVGARRGDDTKQTLEPSLLFSKPQLHPSALPGRERLAQPIGQTTLPSTATLVQEAQHYAFAKGAAPPHLFAETGLFTIRL